MIKRRTAEVLSYCLRVRQLLSNLICGRVQVCRQTHRLEDVGSCLTMCAKTVSLVCFKKLLSVHPCVSVMQPQVVPALTCHHPLLRSESKYARVSLHVYLLSVLSVFLSARHVWFISLLALIKKSPVSSVQIDLHHKSLFHFLPLVFVHS